MPTLDIESSIGHPQGDAGFTYGEICYINLAQHLYYQKALFVGDFRTAEKILNARDPEKLGQLVTRLFDSPAEEAWNAISASVLLEGLYTKFLQEASLCDWLVSQDEDAIGSVSSLWGLTQVDVYPIAHASRVDKCNPLGDALRKVRMLLLAK